MVLSAVEEKYANKLTRLLDGHNYLLNKKLLGEKWNFGQPSVEFSDKYGCPAPKR